MTAFFSLTCADAVEWLRTLPAESVDCVITDSAYESLEEHRAKGTTTRLAMSKSSSNEWFSVVPNAYHEPLLVEFYRVLKKNAHCYMMCDWKTMFVLKPMGEAAGFRLRKPLVWDKQRIGMGYSYRARYEIVMYFEKGKRRLNDLSIPDVLECEKDRGSEYPTQKPVELLYTFVKQSTVEGETVLDCFMGSGSTGEAALKLGRNFQGCDLSERAVARSRARLACFGTEIA